MKNEDTLYDLMERAMNIMASAEDLTTLRRLYLYSMAEYIKWTNTNELNSVVKIAYRSWLDQTYLMVRTYMKE